MLLGHATGLGWPERLDLGDDPLAELVAGPGEREGGVRVQALEPAGAGLAADPAGQLGPEPPLLLVAALGEALQDNPRPGKTTTQSRTFTLQPESQTVTVTAP